MTNLELLENIVSKPFVTYPLMHKELFDVKVYSEFSNFPQSVKSIKRCSVTGKFLLEFSDGNHEETEIDEPLAKTIVNQIKAIAEKNKGKYKPTMTSKQKEQYLNHNHFRLLHDKKREVEQSLDEKYPMFCMCGQLATGLHTTRCRKWQTALTNQSVKALSDMLPKLESIKLPA